MSVNARIIFLAVTVVSLSPSALPQQPTDSRVHPPTVAPPNNDDATNAPGMQPTVPATTAGPWSDIPRNSAPFSDKIFLKRAAELHTIKVELSKLAQDKGSSEGVKEFAKRIVDDHAKIGRNLET